MNRLITYLFLLSSIMSFGQKFDESDLTIPVNSIVINGTLLKPTTNNKPPLVIIIPGSGPTDRNGNNPQMKNNSLKFLAEELALKNIASFRYDKSVLSKENKINVDSLLFSDFIREAREIIRYFKKSKSYSNIIIAGHSQGSLVGMVASQKNVDAFISLEGAGRSIDNILVEQIGKQAPFLKEETIAITSELKKGNTVEEINPLLASVFRKPIQPFMISWIKYNPQEEIKKLKIPILIIQGTKDIQVSELDAKLLHESNPKAQLKNIVNMNHILKEINGEISDNMESYSNPNIPVMEALITTIANFVNEIK